MLSSDAQKLMHWYGRAKRHLPWRESCDPYSVLVSEVMLQQTTVAAVVPKFQSWMASFPTVEALAEASVEQVLSQWSGLGYYQRARRLHLAASAVVEGGGFPNDYEGLLELPGVGPYTAAAVASICFERPELAVDTNVVRTLFRYYALESVAQDRNALKTIREATAPVLGRVHPGDFNQALMELGATLCSISNPSCSRCPLAQGCRAKVDNGGPERFPLSPPPKKARQTLGEALVLKRTLSAEVLLLKGTSLGLLSDLYQPPLLMEQTGGEPRNVELFFAENFGEKYESEGRALTYGISGRKLVLRCRLVELSAPKEGFLQEFLRGTEHPWMWWNPEDPKPAPVSTLTRKILSVARESHAVSQP